ncbi:hypothetical protein GQ457_16G030990 [Hibiscus cannabinus]
MPYETRTSISDNEDRDVLDESQSDTQDFEDEYDSENHMILTKAVLNQDVMEDSTDMFNTAGTDSDDRKQASYDQFGRHT